MRRFGSRILSSTLLGLLTASAAFAGIAHGSVINRTTGKPAANVELTLVDLQGGMAELATAKSDSQGQFTFDNPSVGAKPMLIRAAYAGVTFNTALPPGRPDATVEVFDVSKDPKTVSIDTHVVIFQPNGDKLTGAEEYVIKNNSQPAQAFFRSEGNFEFAIPEKAKLQQVATTGSSGMPVSQAPMDKGKGLHAIAYAFRPGETSVRLSYEVSYPGNAAALKLPAIYSGSRLLIVVPPGVTVTGDGLQSAGQEQGMLVYTHAPLAAKSSLSLNLSGVGSVPSADAADSGQGPAVGQEGNSRTQGPEVQAIPGRLDDVKWYLLGGLAALFAMGWILLSRKQVVLTPVAAGGDEAEVAPPKQSATKPKPGRAPAKTAAPTVNAVNEEVNTNLDSLKDSIFRLELRRQAGTISEEEYAEEHARMEKLLRDLVRG